MGVEVGHLIPLVGLTILNPIMYHLRLKIQGVFKLALSSNRTIIYFGYILIYFNFRKMRQVCPKTLQHFTAAFHFL